MTEMLRCVVWIPALVMLLAAGSGGRPMGDVSGTVTFRGEPLALGTIAFMNADGSVARET